MRVAGLILAAGASSRMGRDKALLEYRGQTFLNRLVHLMLPRADRVVVVLGHHAERIGATLPTSRRVETVVNAEYERGMLSSLQVGLARVGDGPDWILWSLVDHPAIRGRTLDALLSAAAGTDAPLVIPRHGGERGHPILLAPGVARDLLRLPREASPQDAVRRRYAEARFVDTDDAAVLRDIDTLQDYKALGRPDSG